MDRDPEQEQHLNTAFARALRDARGLPALDGTFRQVRWATVIRAKEAKRLRAEAAEAFDVREDEPPSPALITYLHRAVESWLASITDAKVWIDGRDEPQTIFEVAEAMPATGSELVAMSDVERAWLAALWSDRQRRRAPPTQPRSAPLLTPPPRSTESLARVLDGIKDSELRRVLEAAAEAMSTRG